MSTRSIDPAGPAQDSSHPSPVGQARPERTRGFGRRMLGGFGVLMAAGCSPAKVLNALAPRRLVAGDVAYGEGPRRMLDVYAPAARTAGRIPPVVVFLYGGGWKDGSRANYRFVGGVLADAGAIVVIPDYRLYPQVRYPDFLQDCAAAVRWAHDNAGAYDPGFPGAGAGAGVPAEARPVFLMGHSAGAYNAAMLTFDGRWLGETGLVPHQALRGLIGLAGPYDFLPVVDPELVIMFGGANRADTQPISYVGPGTPPAFLATGDKDTTVMPDNTKRLAERIREFGGFVEERVYPGINHVEILGAMAGPLSFVAPTLRDTLGFIGLVGADARGANPVDGPVHQTE